ncbi:MAG: hypothetical protein GY950_17605 [bacterium]|nr:hypothetical protein [bacterium]
MRKKIEKPTLNELREACALFEHGLAGEKIKLRIVELNDTELEKIDPYDFSLIVNPVTFIIPCIRQSPATYESCGYVMEHIVLKATDLHLGTCWLGYFNTNFFKWIPLNHDEIRPAVCVVGYAAEMCEESTRTRWENLFFSEDFYTFLSRQTAGAYYESLEMLRLAPSSGNTQPWRIVKEKNRNTFHFYKKSVDSHYEAIKLHNVDLGIAMCHFELISKKNRLDGNWKKIEQNIYPIPPKSEYIISWIGK